MSDAALLHFRKSSTTARNFATHSRKSLACNSALTKPAMFCPSSFNTLRASHCDPSLEAAVLTPSCSHILREGKCHSEPSGGTMKGVGAFLTAVAVVGVGVIAGAPAAHADDPTVYLGSSLTASNDSPLTGGTETTDSWLYPSSGVAVAGANSYVSFLNNTGSAWSSISIVVTMDSTSGHTFTCDDTPLSPSSTYGSATFTSCNAPNPGSTSTTEDFTFSGGDIASGDYLVFTWNNFPTGDQNQGPLNFAFTATPETAATPEPGSLLLLGSGLLSLGCLIRRKLG
jgi:hypothetical protein